jgi:predicted  nucleic acid-binding Zn-ribbon protein
MKRFVWRLQRVLDIKTKEEQFKRMELFRLTEALTEKRAELLMRQRILQEMIADVARAPAPDRVKTQELFLRHATTNDRCIRGLQENIRNLETRQREKIHEVLAVKRFKEGLEKLRTEAKERYIQEQEKLEQKESDDRTTVAFARNEGMRL